MEEFSVKLYVYELTNGLAKSLSPMFLGRQIDGVWHTGVVVYDQEFYFGGMGIESCAPGCTVLGQPTEIVQLGSTELPFDLFMEHLHELSQSSFRPECYHLLNHNCNTFSDEVAQFLTGKRVPSHITSLPQEVLQTPFGAMIKPFVDAMTVNPAGGHTLFSKPVTSSPTAVAVQSERSVTSRELPPVATYNDKCALGQYPAVRSSLVSLVCHDDVTHLDETYEYVTSTLSTNWSLRPLHVKLLCQLIVNADLLSVDARIALSDVLQMALLFDDVIAVCNHDPSESFVGLVRSLETVDDRLTVHIAKCVCNFVSTKVGAEKFVNVANQAATLVGSISRFLLLHTDRELRFIGSQITSNVLRYVQPVNDDVAFDLGVTLVESCQTADQQSAEYLWFSLCACIEFNTELSALVTATGLNIAEQEQRFPHIIKYTSSTKKFFS